MAIDSFSIFFQYVVKVLPQMKLDKTTGHPASITVGVVESQLKQNRFLYALVHNRKEEFKGELRKIAEELNISQVAKKREGGVTEDDVNNVSLFIRNLFMTSCETKGKILVHLGKLSHDQRKKFFKSLETIPVNDLLKCSMNPYQNAKKKQ